MAVTQSNQCDKTHFLSPKLTSILKHVPADERWHRPESQNLLVRLGSLGDCQDPEGIASSVWPEPVPVGQSEVAQASYHGQIMPALSREPQQLANLTESLTLHCCPWAFPSIFPGYTGSDCHAHSTGTSLSESMHCSSDPENPRVSRSGSDYPSKQVGFGCPSVFVNVALCEG